MDGGLPLGLGGRLRFGLLLRLPAADGDVNPRLRGGLFHIRQGKLLPFEADFIGNRQDVGLRFGFQEPL